MIDLDVELDRRERRKLDQLGRQAPFAIATALTRTAKDAQVRIVQKELPERFTIRSRWVPGGIRFRPATKASLVARVGSVSRFMEQQEVGGERRAGPKGVAIPYRARPNVTSRTPPSRWPGRQLARRNTFIAPIKEGDSTMAVWRRVGKTGRRPLRLLYVLQDTIKIEPRFGLRETATEVVRERFSRNFEWAYERALATAR